MMWWAWLLIWSLLTLGFLGVLAWCSIRLFRKALGTLKAMEDLGNQVAAIDLDVAANPPPFTPAIFADSAVLLFNIKQRRSQRAHRRQQRRDASILRGKLMRNTR